MQKRVIGRSHLSADYFLYDGEDISYFDRENYALLQLPGLAIFIKSQEALDALREALKEKKDE